MVQLVVIVVRVSVLLLPPQDHLKKHIEYIANSIIYELALLRSILIVVILVL